MEKLKTLIKKDVLFYRMIFIFSMLSAGVVLLITLVMFSFITNGVKEEIYYTQEMNLNQVSALVGFRAEYVNSLLLQVKGDEQVSKLFYSTAPIQDSTIVKRLNEIRLPIKQLNSIYICNEKSNRIFYSGESTQMPFVNEQSVFYDRGFLEILDHIEDYPKYTPILRKIVLDLPSGKTYETLVYTYLIYDAYGSGSIQNIVALNFHLGWVRDALSLIGTEEDSYDGLWIVNQDRQIVYADNSTLIGSTCTQEEISDEMLSSNSGYLITGKGKDRQMVTYVTPSQLGYEDWTFVSWIDYARLMQPLEQIRSTIFAVSIAVLLLSLVAIFLLSNIVYEPFRATMEKVKHLEADNEKKRKVERTVFLQKLFLGNLPDDGESIRKLFAEHQIKAKLDGDLQVALISIDDAKHYYDTYDKFADVPSETIQNSIIQQYHKIGIHPLCVKMHGSLWAVCVSSQGRAEIISQVFRDLNRDLNEKMGISISMAVSQLGHSVQDIPFLYSEALAVMSFRFLTGKNSMLTSDMMQQHSGRGYEYPNDIEKKLLSSLFGGKYTETAEKYQEFTGQILSFSVEDIRLSFILLAHAIKAASHKSFAEASGILAEFDRFYKRLGDAETLDAVDTMFDELFREITQKLKQNSKERHEALIDQIESYVHEHYGDINLSMNDISDSVNMSAAYLGRLFKQVTGITFIEYLTKFRLKEACRLLTTTDMTINDISDRVGFTNCSYFYIIFKKNLECTPNQYRQQHTGETSAE